MMWTRKIAGIILFCFAVGISEAQMTQSPQPCKVPAEAMKADSMAGMKMEGGKSAMDMAAPKPPAGPLKLGFGDKSAEWTAATLAPLPHLTVTVYNTHAKACETYSGVPLMELLKQIGVPAMPHGKDLQLYLVAEGFDGYKAAYALAEVNPAFHDATVIVADAMNGKPIADDGPLKLVATGEKRPARWVRNLVAVKVKAAE